MKLEEITGIPPEVSIPKRTRDLVLSRCRVGIEVEAEGLSGFDISMKMRNWKIAHEGGLNNGLEFISKVIHGTSILSACGEIDDILTANKAYCSYRTGLHIHMDVRRLSLEQLTTFLCVCMLFEPLLYEYCGEDRRVNPYCVPLTDGDGTSLLGLLRVVQNTGAYTKDSIRRRISGSNGTKYAGINIRPVVKQGSVEFRMHKGTFDRHEIVRWINILMYIRKFAMSQELSTLPSVIERVCPDQEGLLSEVFGKLSGNFLERVSEVSLVDSARILQYILAISGMEVVNEGVRPRRIGDAIPDGAIDLANNVVFRGGL